MNIKSRKNKKENIDQYIRKELIKETNEKYKKYKDPLISELDYYDMPINDLISTQNITKNKIDLNKTNTLKDKETESIINRELTLNDDGNDDEIDGDDDDLMITNNTNSPYNEIFGDFLKDVELS